MKKKEPFLEPIIRSIRFRKILKKIKPKSILVDIGCGHTPFLLNRLENYIKQGIGIDPFVTAFTSKRVRLISKKLDDKLPLKSNFADHVSMAAVLEHLDNPLTVLREALRVLKPGGTILLTTPSPISKPILEFLSFQLNLVSVREIAEHKKYYWKKDLLEALTDAGFEKASHHYFEFFCNNFVTAFKPLTTHPRSK